MMIKKQVKALCMIVVLVALSIPCYSLDSDPSVNQPIVAPSSGLDNLEPRMEKNQKIDPVPKPMPKQKALEALSLKKS